MSGATDLLIRLLVDDSDLDKVDQSKSRFDKFSAGLDTASVASGAWLGGVAIVGAQAVEALKEIEVINAQTEQVIASTGGAANVTAAHVEALAGELEGLTATEGEAIQEGANLLLTFKNIQNGVGEGNDIFDQATASLVDMARAMDEDPVAGAVRLGKALNDPIAGLGALSKVGVQFTDDQKALVESLVESGDMMGAQKIILGELNSQFGGSGAAYMETLAGQQELLGHRFGEVTESLTAALMPTIVEFLDVANGIAIWATENTELLGFIVGAITVAAVAVLAINGAVKVFAAVQAVQTAAQLASNAAWLASPVTWIILAIIAAITLLVLAGIWLVENWDGVSEWFGNMWQGLMNGASAAVGWIGDRISDFVGFFLSIPQQIGNAFGWLGETLRNIAHTVATAIAWLWNNTFGNLSFDMPFGLGRIEFPQLVVPALAAGGIVTGPTLALIGEAGPEAVVPLSHGSGYGLDRPIVIENVIKLDRQVLAREIRKQNERDGYGGTRP